MLVAAAICGGQTAGDDDLAWAESILGSVGLVVRVPESQIDAVTGVAGSGPAYLFLVAEALIEAGVLAGLTRPTSEALVAQLFVGSAAVYGHVDAQALPIREEQPLRPAFAAFPWRNDATQLRAWQKGLTGYPVVDAGMRQLLATGWMHNRVRMVAASFLVKHLHLDWRWGARWFMWRLFDGDLASNQHGWQWTAGTGTDAAPYHRIFNPTTQAERFDPRGEYVTTFIPELRGTAAPQCLQPGGGEGLLAPTGYVAPIVEAKAEREEALRRFAEAREMAKAARG